MKKEYTAPSITVPDYKLETYLDTMSSTTGTRGDESDAKTRIDDAASTSSFYSDYDEQW